jgi:drug/metabolite transporter (DMT)-like permease
MDSYFSRLAAGRIRRQPGGPATATATASGLAAVGMWGLAPVATRALVVQLAPLPLLVLRMVVAGIVLLPWCVPMLRRLHRASAGRLVVAGLLGMVGYMLPVTVGIQWLPASTAALILATEPVWIMFLGRVFRAERVPGWSWAGAGIAIGGITVIAGPGVLSAGSGIRQLAGIGLVTLGTAAFAAYTIALRPLSAVYGPRAATATSTVAGAVPYLAVAWLLPEQHLDRLPGAAWGELAFLALGSTVAGMLLWNLAVARAGSTRAGLLLFLEPLVGVTGGVALLGERLSAGIAAGGALVLLGVGIAWAAQRRAGRAGESASDDGARPGGGGPGQQPDSRDHHVVMFLCSSALTSARGRTLPRAWSTARMRTTSSSPACWQATRSTAAP